MPTTENLTNEELTDYGVPRRLLTEDNAALLAGYLYGPLEEDEISEQIGGELHHRGFDVERIAKAKGKALGRLLQRFTRKAPRRRAASRPEPARAAV